LRDLRDALDDCEPPPAVDAFVARASTGRATGSVSRARRALPRHVAWALALAASIAMVAVVHRGFSPMAARDASPVRDASPPGRSAAFVPVVAIEELQRTGDALVVSATIPRLALAQFGMTVDPASATDRIATELLVRPDGAVLAVRFVP